MHREVYSAVYYSSLTGMQEVLDCLLKRGENANMEGGRFGNALQAASYEGYEGIVKLLLKNGAAEVQMEENMGMHFRQRHTEMKRQL